ncbi:MAG: sigma-70 family RNA polymerase sigma factor [Pseudomonadota bacterium]|nr:sigma-70 family RNA polymerase sigma factor [Pseudomonadota bacterium]
MTALLDIEAAQAGDKAAFARLHTRWHPVVHAVLLARLPVEDAEDLVQEVFVTAWLRLGELTDRNAFGGWVCAIARHRAVDHWRARRPTEPLTVDPAAPPASDRGVHDVLAAVQALPEAYRETLLLRLVAGYTGPEISERTGLTEGSVRVNLTRGMALLRERIGEHR